MAGGVRRGGFGLIFSASFPACSGVYLARQVPVCQESPLHIPVCDPSVTTVSTLRLQPDLAWIRSVPSRPLFAGSKLDKISDLYKCKFACVIPGDCWPFSTSKHLLFSHIFKMLVSGLAPQHVRTTPCRSPHRTKTWWSACSS